jgi:hypothetical protein
MAVILAHEMVQIGLIQELISIDYVKAIGQSNEGRRSDNCENHSVLCKEAFLAVDSLESFIFCQLLHIHIYPEEQYK